MKYTYVLKVKSCGKNWNGERTFLTLDEAENEILPILRKKYEDVPKHIKFTKHKWSFLAYGNIEYILYRVKYE